MTLRCLCRKVMTHVNLRLCSSSTDKNSVTTAGIVVIGDEILKGEVPDSNSTFMAKELHRLGLKLKKISVVPDDVQEICDEIKSFSSLYDYVLTTGGIGPTHDDLTYESVSRAFNEPLILHPELKEVCERFFKTKDPNGAGMKLAYVPKSSKLHHKTTSGGKLRYPNVYVHNVYMFPGVPELLQRTMIEAGPLLFKTSNKFFTRSLYCNIPEYRIISELKQLVDEFPDVQFGCYPKFWNSEYKVKVTVESSSEEATIKAYQKLKQLIPEDTVVNKLDDM